MLKALSRAFKMLTQVNPNLEQDIDTIINSTSGMDNLVETGACATRLRLTLKDTAIADQKALKAHGAYDVVIIDERHIRVKANTIHKRWQKVE